MGYFDAIKGSFLAAIVFFIIVQFTPDQGPSKAIEIILTISTFLFAILAGFFISRLNARYNRINESFASEDAHWLSIYKTSQLLDKTFAAKVVELIDKYYIIAFDFVAGDYYKHNAKHYLSIWDELGKVKFSNSKTAEISSRLIDYLTRIEDLRNSSSVASRGKLSKGQWLVLYLLSSIIVFSIFFLKEPAVYSQVIAVMLSTAVVTVLLIIRDLQNLRLSGESLLAESGQEVLEVIGKTRYYSNELIKKGYMAVPKHVKHYRLGMHKPGEKIEVRIVKR